MKTLFGTLVVTLLFTAYSASAVTPEAKLPYQKKLTAAPTASATTTPVSFTFKLFDAEIDGTQYWEETRSINVTSTTRLISATLGEISGLNPADFSRQLWVQVESNGRVIGAREKLIAVPYALWSATSDVPGVPGPQGPKGDQGDPGYSIVGPAGPMGPSGLQGEKGNTGAAGTQGVKGDTGLMGPAGGQGMKGDTGLTGPVGPQGVQGPKGDTGLTGPAGPQGATGSTGAQGVQGVAGLPGPMGPAGAQGMQGVAGVQGPQGLTGPQGPAGGGVRWRGPFDAFGAAYAVGDITEYDGSSWIAVDTVPNLCDTEKCVEPVKEMWPRPGTIGVKQWELVAAAGVAGSKGAQGPQGLQGAAGENGRNGQTGPAGIQGPAGPQGPAGGGLPSLDALRGVPCNLGTLYPGTVEITYAAANQFGGSVLSGRRTVNMECNFPVGHELQIILDAPLITQCGQYHCSNREYNCGYLGMSTCYEAVYCPNWCSNIIDFSSQPTGISGHYSQSITTASGPSFYSYQLPAGIVLTLTEPNGGVFSGDCTGTGSCTITMDGPKTVTITR